MLGFWVSVAGINMVKRKLAAHDNLKITIQQNGDKFHVKESSTFRTLEIDFTLGVTFEYSLADGTELSVSKLLRSQPFSRGHGDPSIPEPIVILSVRVHAFP